MSEAIPTSAVTVLSSTHGRLRREQRNISKRDLKAAILYGTKECAGLSHRGEARWKYTFADIVYITDATSTKEITSWPLQCCGIDVETVTITPTMRREHKMAKAALSDMTIWTSHTVAVVDQSGSMRKSDTSGGATRADIVWLVLALDFVGKRILSGEVKATDAFSLVGMRAKGDILLKMEPLDWVLYNRLIQLLRSAHPMGDGNYIPSLDKAEELLSLNPYSSCAPLLIFLSDGRPSDNISINSTTRGKEMSTAFFSAMTDLVKERIAELASHFGRRLTVGAIALGNESENSNFSTLKVISDVAKEYGSAGYYHTASLSVDALAKTFTHLSTTLTTTKTELTELGSTHQRRVKQVQRETIQSLGGHIVTDSWFYCTNEGCLAGNNNIVKTNWTKTGWKSTGDLFLSPDATGVAVKKKVFGEGAERMVREFREVDTNGNFVGPSMVGKESRFMEIASSDKKEFHKIFCKTQQTAQKYAAVFNERISCLLKKRISHSQVPTIEFLECSVYMIVHPKMGRVGLLVEKMLDIQKYKYMKWNSNHGYVHVFGDRTQEEETVQVGGALGGISEDTEEEDDDSSTDDAHEILRDDNHFEIEDIPQAFSCFTYRYSNRRLLVCDLQGIYNTLCSPPIFEMTDPVIHYKSARQRKNLFGRTDKGEEGIHNFYKTHKCSNLCRMVDPRTKISIEDPSLKMFEMTARVIH